MLPSYYHITILIVDDYLVWQLSCVAGGAPCVTGGVPRVVGGAPCVTGGVPRVVGGEWSANYAGLKSWWKSPKAGILLAH